jgi:hypothetical protein
VFNEKYDTSFKTLKIMLFLIFLPRDRAVCGKCCKLQPCKVNVFEDI